MVVFLRPHADSQAAMSAVRASLAQRASFHPDDADAILSFDIAQILSQMDLLDTGLTLFVGLAGTITLLIGGIGIANYQLATLSERATEVGVAKALGARDRVLMGQAVLESVLVSGSAGLLGVGLGLSVTWAAQALVPPGLFPAPVLSMAGAGIALIALLGVSTVAALVPALRVRRMDISLALRESG